jgi:hypothetical protein
VDAHDVQTILDLCDPATVKRFSSINVATAFSKMAKRAKLHGGQRSPLGDHPAFLALCRRAIELLELGEFPHRPVCNSAHALATLQHRALVTVVDGNGKRVDGNSGVRIRHPAVELWRALYAAMPRVRLDERSGGDTDAMRRVVGGTDARARPFTPNAKPDSNSGEGFGGSVRTSARQSTMFLYASALAKDPPCASIMRGIWRELRVDETRVASHHVSNIVWACATLGLDPGSEGWGIVERRVPEAFKVCGSIGSDADSGKDPGTSLSLGGFNSQNVANTWWGFAKLRRAPSDASVRALSRALVIVSESGFKPQELANAMWSRAFLKTTRGVAIEPEVQRAFDAAVLNAREGTVRGRAGRETRHGPPGFKSQELSQVFWHYATADVAPPERVWKALDEAARVTARAQSPMDVSLTLWACATLGTPPSPRTWAALERRFQGLVDRGRVGSDPGGTASLGVRARLENAPDASRLGHVAVEWQQVSNIIWAYAKLRTMPDAKTLRAVHAAFDRLASSQPESMTPQDASMLLWGHVTLGLLPPARSTRTAFFEALERRVSVFKPDELTNAIWCVAVAKALFGGLEGEDPPRADVNGRELTRTNLSILDRAYYKMWDRLATLEKHDFATTDGVLIAHHAAVVHNELLLGNTARASNARSKGSESPGTCATANPEDGCLPSLRRSLVDAARDAWRVQNRRNRSEDRSMSSSQRRVGGILRRAGYAFESEKEIDAGFGLFPATQTVDFYLPDSGLVVEYDGPHHYHEIAGDPRRERFHGLGEAARERNAIRLSYPNGIDPGVIRNVNTRLRDALFAKNAIEVVALPWWEMRGVKHADQEKWLVERIAAAANRVRAEAKPSGGSARTESRNALIARWLEASPVSSRAKLQRAWCREEDADENRWRAVLAAARKDATRVRARLREEIEALAE